MSRKKPMMEPMTMPAMAPPLRLVDDDDWELVSLGGESSGSLLCCLVTRRWAKFSIIGAIVADSSLF
jgi:hypothetical protein